MRLTYRQYLIDSFKDTPQVYFDYIYRKLSHPVSYSLLRAGVTPNNISIVSISIAIVAGFVLAFRHPYWGLVLFMVSYLLDFCDGSVARVIMKHNTIALKHRQRGMILESINTNASLAMLYWSLGFYFTIAHQSLFFMAFGFFVFTIKIITRYAAHQISLILANTSTANIYKSVNEQYRASFWVQLKFLVRKSMFSANFYYAVYLICFFLAPRWASQLFIVYGSLDASVNLFRLFLLFTKIK